LAISKSFKASYRQGAQAMKHDKQSGQERYQFSSLAELSEYLDTTPRKWRQNSSERESANQSWDLGADYKTAWQYARQGWLEGAAQIKKALKLLPPATPRPKNVNDFYGHLPHVARFCAGAPDSMIRQDRKAQNGMGAVLTLIVPVNALANVRAEHMRNFGTGLAHYIANLEANGTRVEVLGTMVSKVHSTRCAHTWTVKRASQPLDLPVLAFAIGHPAMFRRIGFALRERVKCREMTGYGETVPAQLSDIISAPNGAYILNGMARASEVARTPEQASAYIKAQLDKAFKNKEAA
jgi:hypothetical protein